MRGNDKGFGRRLCPMLCGAKRSIAWEFALHGLSVSVAILSVSVAILFFSSMARSEQVDNVSQLLQEMETLCLESQDNIEAAGFATQHIGTQLFELGERAIPKIVTELGDSTKPNSYRYLLAEFVGLQKAREARPTLEAILADTSENVLLRHRAARSLGQIGDKKSLQPLLMALDDSERLVRMGAAKGLGRLKDPAAAQKLIQKLRPDAEDKQVNLRICYALGEIKGNNARHTMLALIKHQDPSYRYAAVRALGRMGDKSATMPLIDLLHKERGIRRGEIMKALAQIGDERAIPVLIDEVRDGDPLSVGKAAEALVQLKATQAVPDLLKAREKKENRNAFTDGRLQKAIEVLSGEKGE